jgi:putative spermidine/putrescine transport system substrate-binding protein
MIAFGSSGATRRRAFRRLATVSAAVAGSAALLAACGGGAPSQDAAAGAGSGSDASFTYASYGGTTEEAVIEAWGAPYAEEFGAEPQYASPVELGKIRAMVEADAVEWDLVQSDFSTARNAQSDTLYQEIDTSGLDTSDLLDNAVKDRAVGAYVLSYLIAYNNETYADAGPQNWADFYDLEKFPGARGVENWPQIILETALLADGVAPEDLYPLDLDRAFAKLDTIKDQIVWYSTGAEQQQLIQSGTVDMLMAWNGRAYDLVKKGEPVSVEFGQQLTYVGYHVIPTGAKNAKAATDFIGVSLLPENQAAFAELTSYSPVSKAAIDLVSEEIRPYLPTAPENLEKAVWVDEQYWIDNLEEVNARWTEWQVS